MQLFLDTANVEQIRQGVRLGVISGVTTNPTLIAKEGRADYKAAILEICSLVKGPVSVEAVSQDRDGIITEARQISSWSPYIAVKIPVSAQGLEATAALTKEGIKVNLTLCFSVNQAILGALAGATYVSLFVGRLDDAGHNGMALVRDIVEVFSKYNLNTRVIAASIRHPLHCVEAAKAGAHIATVPYAVFMQMLEHPLTTSGIQRFLDDWKKFNQTVKG